MSDLPIDQHLDHVKNVLVTSNRLMLIAQPGAGKTTRVPLALLTADWVEGQKLLLLEPRSVRQWAIACAAIAVLARTLA